MAEPRKRAPRKAVAPGAPPRDDDMPVSDSVAAREVVNPDGSLDGAVLEANYWAHLNEGTDSLEKIEARNRRIASRALQNRRDRLAADKKDD